jgi:hypothetical protein
MNRLFSCGQGPLISGSGNIVPHFPGHLSGRIREKRNLYAEEGFQFRFRLSNFMIPFSFWKKGKIRMGGGMGTNFEASFKTASDFLLV